MPDGQATHKRSPMRDTRRSAPTSIRPPTRRATRQAPRSTPRCAGKPPPNSSRQADGRSASAEKLAAATRRSASARDIRNRRDRTSAHEAPPNWGGGAWVMSRPINRRSKSTNSLPSSSICCSSAIRSDHVNVYSGRRSSLFWPALIASSAVLMSSFVLMIRTIVRSTDKSLRVADPPGLLVADRGPRHDREVAAKGGLQESATADLLNRDESATEVLDPPDLGAALLLRAGDHPEVPCADLRRIEEAAAADLLDRAHTGAQIGHAPLLGGVEAPVDAGDDTDIPVGRSVNVQ